MEKAKLKDTIDHLPGGLLITDRESRVLYASAALERRTGFSVAEIVGKKPGELWGGKMERPFYDSLWQTIGAEGRAFVGEVKNTRKNGAKQDEHLYIVPIRDQAGETAYFAEIHPELSGRESEVGFAREFLRRTEDMVQGDDFFSWMFQHLRKGKEGTIMESDRSFQLGGFRDAAHFLRDAFVTPTEKIFARRSEDALLIAHAQADPELFSELYDKYAKKVREYFARRLRGDYASAEDLTQEVFIRAFRYLSGFRMANASYYTYLLHVAHNVLVNFYRKRRYDMIAYEEERGIGNVPAKSGNAAFGDMNSMLRTLSETERSVMLWKYRDGLKAKEIAEKIGKTVNAVKLILSRSRKKLKTDLK